MEREHAEADAGGVWETSCPRCRYDTFGLAAERCPECGLTLSESLRLRAEQDSRRQQPLERAYSLCNACILIVAGPLALLVCAQVFARLAAGVTGSARAIIPSVVLLAIVSLAAMNLQLHSRQRDMHPWLWFGVLANIALWSLVVTR